VTTLSTAVPATPGARAPRVATVNEIRARFPSLERRHQDRFVAYLDGPGGTQVPRDVVDAMNDYLYRHNANTHWNYPTSHETDAMLDAARAALADFVNGAPNEIAFGANMTTLTFHLGRALGRGWGAGDEIVVTELDHHANVAPWRALEKERGVRVVMARMRTEDGTTDFDDLAQKIGPRTKLLAIGAASNALGTISDVARAAAMARAHGALVFVDAVHYAPHNLVDVRALDCDFLACSAYKFYGPHIGILWGKHDLLQGLDVPKLDPAPSEAPENLETGTQNHEGIVGAGAAVNFLASLATDAGPRRQALAATFAELHARGEKLLGKLWTGLERVRGIRVYGVRPGKPRTPTVGFTLANVPSRKVAGALADAALFVSHGDFYAATIIERLGLGEEGLVRVGCSAYTTEEEIARLVDTVATIARP
jgi:cysteine desulfurase family protein (TIGR01976 family)